MICETCKREIGPKQAFWREDDSKAHHYSCLPKAERSEAVPRCPPSAPGCSTRSRLDNDGANQRRVVETKAELAAVVAEEIEGLKLQIELLQLRIKEFPERADFIRPFGSNLWLLKCRLERALKAASAPPCGERARLDNADISDRR